MRWRISSPCTKMWPASENALVAMREHWDALRKRQRCEKRAHQPIPRLDDGRVVGLPFRSPVATQVVVVAVLVVFAVRDVVLLLVAHQVAQGVAVVRRDEVDAGVRAAAALRVEVAASRQPRRQFRHHDGHGLLEVADLVTEMTKVKHPMDAGQKGQRGIEW